MGRLRNRIRVLVERVRAGEGADVLADLGETAEHWLKSERSPVPGPLRRPAGKLGTALGRIARTYRRPPVEVPPPDEVMEDERQAREREPTPIAARAHREAGGSNGGRAKKSRPEGPDPAAKKPKGTPKSGKREGGSGKRVSARRSTGRKRPEPSNAPPAPEPAGRSKTTNGKGKPKRPAARRSRDDKTSKPT